MVTPSQILVTVGLILEAGATLYAIRELFYGYYARIMKSARLDPQKREEEMKDGIIILALLILGIVLQGLSVFILT